MKILRKGLAAILCLTVLIASVVYAIDINSNYDYDAKAVFADVPMDHWAYSQIASLAGNGVFSGDENNMFYPDSYITKASTAQVISKFMKLEPYTAGEFVYSDVPEDSPYCEYAYAAHEFFPVKKGSLENERLFEGGKLLTRAELCYAVVHMIYAESEASFKTLNSLKKYDDYKEIDEELAPYVAVMLDKGLIMDYEDNKIRANDPVSKADLAVVLFECVTPRIYAAVTQNGVEVLQAYGEDQVLKVSVKKFGPNSLADFYDWSFRKTNIKNGGSNRYYENGFGAESLPWEDFMAQREADKSHYLSSSKHSDETSPYLYNAPFKTSCTDYFSPYVVRAKNNIDGDAPDSYDFTGGYHTNTGASAKNAATARNAELTVKVNGVEVEDEFHGKATYIDVVAVNYIQASNTKKLDGTGREVLKETRNLHFDGDKWNFTIEIEALEDVEIHEYYGAQFDLVGVGDKITFISDDYYKSYAVGNSRIQSPNADCKKIVIEGDKIDTEIAVNFKLPKDGVNNRGYSSFYESYGKSYFNSYFSLGNPLNLKPEEKMVVEGYYRFRELEDDWKKDMYTDEESVEQTETPAEELTSEENIAEMSVAEAHINSTLTPEQRAAYDEYYRQKSQQVTIHQNPTINRSEEVYGNGYYGYGNYNYNPYNYAYPSAGYQAPSYGYTQIPEAR